MRRLAALFSRGRRRSATDELGRWGEDVARKRLAADPSLRLVGRRVRVGLRDEIDLIFESADTTRPELVFVEVKTRASDAFGGGLASINRRKRHALCRAVAHYLRTRPPVPFRIDVVEVVGSFEENRVDRFAHYPNAVPMERRFLHEGLSRRTAR